ncbi:hypothetical protein [Candidatus Spongiihabitans sp.]
MAHLNPRGDAMQIQHIGYGIRGFYRAAKIGHRWDYEPSSP